MLKLRARGGWQLLTRLAGEESYVVHGTYDTHSEASEQGQKMIKAKGSRLVEWHVTRAVRSEGEP